MNIYFFASFCESSHTVKALDLPTKPNAAAGLFSSSAVLGAVLPQVLAARPARRRHLGARMKDQITTSHLELQTCLGIKHCDETWQVCYSHTA